MSRYIDADVLISDSRICGNCKDYELCDGNIAFCPNASARRAINDAPTTDVKPVRHGRLICVEAEPEKVRCDYCKTDYLSSDLLNIGADEEKVNFCPNCGAKLDGGENIVIQISEEFFGTLAICAVRYCQGRMTYMPDLVRSIIRPHLKELSDKTLTVLINDCDFQSRCEIYGDEEIDKPGWIKWEQELKAERERRKNNG